MKNIDPTKMQDWQIAAEAEKKMKTIFQLAEEIGIEKELLPYGNYIGKIDYLKAKKHLAKKKNGKYIDITAITPTPLGEGKSTTTMGLVQGLGYIGKKVSGAIRQPSGGPTFNIKGSAAGGGLAQCIPLQDFSLGLTGDIDSITNAHNLMMVAISSRLQHEYNYSDKFLAKRNWKRLNINPRNLPVKWTIDFSAQALREIVMGIGGKLDGFMMKSGFQISVSSELMAILAVATSLEDMRERIGKMVVGYENKKAATPITTKDLEVDGAMTALMIKAIHPTLMQTIEGQPIFVHAGPFANIAIGQSSIIADYLGLKLSDYHITESGFGADIGYEKFCNLKCRYSGLKPDAAVVVATIRALKMHGGGPSVVPGKDLDNVYKTKDTELVSKGLDNMLKHIENVKKSGVSPVVCLNHFYTDTDEEIDVVRKAVEKAGSRFAVSKHWLEGGKGAKELAEVVIEAANEKTDFKYLYDEKMTFSERIEKIATEMYGADGVSYSDEAIEKIEKIESDPELKDMGPCMAKTHLSLTHKPHIKGRPTGWTLPIEDVLTYHGAGFVVPVAGNIKLMPGTGSNPGFRNIDVNTKTGKVTGLF